MLDLGLGVLMDADSSATFATADGIAVGTVDYMSPEQACGQTVDGRSDLFSLGCSMYHLITGRQAFPGDSPIERLGKRIKGRPVPITDLRPDLPSSLVAVLDRLMANNPNERYQKAEEAAEALSGLIRSKKSAAKPSRAAESRPASEAPPAPAPDPIEVQVNPEYPGWFRPLAKMAERSSASALMVVLVGLGLAFLAGMIVGKLIR